MPDQSEGPLRKKLAPPRSSWTMLHPMERLCREELPRLSEDRLGLEVEVVTVTLDYLARDALVDHLRDDQLIFIYAADDGPAGVVCADAELLSALIEIQMLGRVLGHKRRERKPTSTDAVIVRRMIAEWAELLGGNLLQMSDDAMLGPRVADTRAARLSLDDGHFRVLSVTLDLGAGQRQGLLEIACPDMVMSGDRTGPSQDALLRRHLDRVETPFRAVLATLPMAMSELSGLSEGDVLPLPTDAMSNVGLASPRGQILATARLGKVDRRRAVRLKAATNLGQKSDAAKKLIREVEKLDGESTSESAE